MLKQEFNYTGKTQVFDIMPSIFHNEMLPTPYIIECYGADGYSGNRGNYVKAILTVNKPRRLYINVGEAGGQGENKYGWYSDGQGYSPYYNKYGYRCSGGSTDISLVGIEDDTVWNREDHFNNILLRAKGGNGSSYTDYIGMSCPQGTRTCNTTGQSNIVTSLQVNTTYQTTHVNGHVAVSLGGGKSVRVINIRPISNGKLHFYSYNPHGNPTCFVYDESNKYKQGHYWDNNGNFNLEMDVKANVTYRLYCSFYDTAYLFSTNYDWAATFPTSNVTPATSVEITDTVYTGANGNITNTLGTSGTQVLSVTPKVSGTLTFYSDNKTKGDPYCRIYSSSGTTWTNDDGNGNLNFKLSISVEANKTYYLYCGSIRDYTYTIGNPPVSSYAWHATFPKSILTTVTSNFTKVYIYRYTITGGINNYPNIINESEISGLYLSNIETSTSSHSGNGLVRITKMSPIPKNSNFRFDAIYQEVCNYETILNI